MILTIFKFKTNHICFIQTLNKKCIMLYLLFCSGRIIEVIYFHQLNILLPQISEKMYTHMIFCSQTFLFKVTVFSN